MDRYYMDQIPEDIEKDIWKIVYKSILNEMMDTYKPIWQQNSNTLDKLTMDKGCFQGIYQSGVDELVEDHYLLDKHRMNCNYCKLINKFPCPTCKFSLFDNKLFSNCFFQTS